MRMMLRSAAVGLAALFCMGQAAPERIEYTLTPVMESGALVAVQYDLRFRGEADGETELRLPDSWGGQNELWRGVANIEAPGAAVREGEMANQRIITHRPNARLHVRYRVIQDWEGAPSARQGNTYRPVIQPGYFHLIGDASLVTPAAASQDTPVRFRVRNLPRGWTFASDLEHAGLTLGGVWSSITVGGDFRIVRASDPNIRVAMRGQWGFSSTAFAEEVTNIVAGQRRFWGDESTPYLVTVLQLDVHQPGWVSIGGTGLGDAFAFFATPQDTTAPITRTLAHESLHTWVPHAVGGLEQEDQALSYWFSEGFTDFYTSRLLVRDGAWTPADFAADLNGMLAAYAQSPAREEPNARVLADFWNDRDVQQLPYQRGRLLATLWDARLRAAGHDLDDVMFEMRARARGGDPLKSAQMFPLAAQRFGLDATPEIAAHIGQGAFITLPEDVSAPCGRVVTRQRPRFHRGFDIEATQANNNIVAGVDPALPAYAAGVRDGMVLVRRDGGEIGNAELEIAYVMRVGDEERTFRYMPRGRDEYTQQAFELADDLQGEQLAQCIRVLGGA